MAHLSFTKFFLLVGLLVTYQQIGLVSSIPASTYYHLSTDGPEHSTTNQVTDEESTTAILTTKESVQSTTEAASDVSTSTPVFPCGEEFIVSESDSSKRGYFTTPNYPFAYPNNVNCVWKIKGPVGYFVKIQFRSVATEKGYDFIKVFPGTPTCEQIKASNMEPLMKASGISKSNIVIVSSNEALVNFNSDQHLVADGFLATFELIPDNQELMMEGNSGIGMSPGYPGQFIPAAHMTNVNEPDVATYTWHISTGFSSERPSTMFGSMYDQYSGVVVRFPSLYIPAGGEVILKDMGNNCQNGTLIMTNASTNYEAVSNCNQVTITLKVPDGQSSLLQFHYNALCDSFYCSEYGYSMLNGSYTRYIFGGLVLILLILMAVSTCLCITCCCCAQQSAARVSSPDGSQQRVVIRRRRVCGRNAAFANPGYDEERPERAQEATVANNNNNNELPKKEPLKANDQQ